MVVNGVARKNKLPESLYDGNFIINRSLSRLSQQITQIPSFVADYLISQLVDPDSPSEGMAKIDRLLSEHSTRSEHKELIKSKIRENGHYRLLGHIKVRYDQNKDCYWANIPALDDSFVRINRELLFQHGTRLLINGIWGAMDIVFDPSFRLGTKIYPFYVIKLDPMQITEISVDGWIESRTKMETEEWIDLLINTIGFDPSKLSRREKVLHLCRLVPMIENRTHLVELGPTESGKTYGYRNLSPFTHIVTSGHVTVASLFYNQSRREVGLIGANDVVCFDEITTDNVKVPVEIVNMLKDSLNSGQFTRGNQEFMTDCSVVFIGNISTNRDTKSVVGFRQNLFSEFPSTMSMDRAFIDRITGFIPGWEFPRISASLYSNDYGFATDYFSQIMHEMRSRSYSGLINSNVCFGNMSQRSSNAVSRIAEGLIKLIFPHRTATTVANEELSIAIDMGIEMRQRVIDQLAYIAPGEFSGIKLGYEFKKGAI